MVIFNHPLGTVSVDSWEILELSVAILALDIHLSDGGARFGSGPRQHCLAAGNAVNGKLVLLRGEGASPGAGFTAHIFVRS